MNRSLRHLIQLSHRHQGRHGGRPVGETHFDAAGSPAPQLQAATSKFPDFAGGGNRIRAPATGPRSSPRRHGEGGADRPWSRFGPPRSAPPGAKCGVRGKRGSDPREHDRSRAGASAGRSQADPGRRALVIYGFSDGAARTCAQWHAVAKFQFGMPIMQSLKRCACIWPI